MIFSKIPQNNTNYLLSHLMRLKPTVKKKTTLILCQCGQETVCQSAKLCNMLSRGGCQQCLFLRSLPAAGHLCGAGEPAGHVPGHLRTAATLRGVLLQASPVRPNGNQTRGQCQIQPGREERHPQWLCFVFLWSPTGRYVKLSKTVPISHLLFQPFSSSQPPSLCNHCCL